MLAAQGSFTRTGAGDFDCDGQEDVAVLAGTRLDVMLAPGIYETLLSDLGHQDEGRPVLDFAVLSGDGKDQIAVIDVYSGRLAARIAPGISSPR